MAGISFKVGEKVKLTYKLPDQRAPRTAVVIFRSRQQNRLNFDAGPGGSLTLELRYLTEIRRLPSTDPTFLHANRAISA